MANRAVHCVANRQRNADLDSGRQGNGKQSPHQYAAVRADKAEQAAHDTRIKTRQGIIAKIVVSTDSKASPMTATAITSHRAHQATSHSGGFAALLVSVVLATGGLCNAHRSE